MNESCRTLPFHRRTLKGLEQGTDLVTIEEPFEIRIGGEPVSVTMRTPGHDLDLTVGFLFTEGVISLNGIPEMRKAGKNAINVLAGKRASSNARRLRSRFFISSSCGLCGRTSAAQVRRRLGCIKNNQTIPASVFEGLPDKMHQQQETFGVTGGLHAATLFDAKGSVLIVREDVGRHNAVDKAIGGWIRSHHKMDECLGLMVSGRASFEIVQKALAAKIPFVAAVSAPSSLAVELACDAGITLVAFLRGGTFNIYSRHDRVVME